MGNKERFLQEFAEFRPSGPTRVQFSKLRTWLVLGLYLLGTMGAIKSHAVMVPDNSKTELNRIQDMDLLETQLRKLEVNLMSVIDFLKARVNPVDMKRQNTRDKVYVDFHLDDEFGSSPMFENQLDQIIERIALLLGQNPDDFKTPQKKQKIYQALLAFFRMKAINGGNEKRGLASTGINQSLLKLAEAFGIDQSKLTPQLQNTLRGIGDMLTRVQKVIFDSGPYDSGGGGKAAASKPGVAGGAGAPLDPAAAVLAANDINPTKEAYMPEPGDGSVARNLGAEDRPPSVNLNDRAPGVDGLPPYQPYNNSMNSSGGSSAPFNSSLASQPSRGSDGASPSFIPPPHQDKRAGGDRNLAGAPRRDGYDPSDFLGNTPVKEKPEAKKADAAAPTPQKKPLISNEFAHLVGAKGVNSPKVKSQIFNEFAEHGRTPEEKAALQKEVAIKAMAAAKTHGYGGMLTSAAQEMSKATEKAQSDFEKLLKDPPALEEMCKNRLGDIFHKILNGKAVVGPDGEQHIYKDMDDWVVAQALPAFNANKAEIEKLGAEATPVVKDTESKNKDIWKGFKAVEFQSFNSKETKEYWNRMAANTMILNSVAGSATPSCVLLHPNWKFPKISESKGTENICQSFGGNFEQVTTHPIEHADGMLKLASLHSFVKWNHINGSVQLPLNNGPFEAHDSKVLEKYNSDKMRTTDGEKTEADHTNKNIKDNVTDEEAMLGGNIRLIHNSFFGFKMLSDDDGVNHNILAKQLLNPACDGEQQWGGMIRKMEEQLRKPAIDCKVNEAINIKADPKFRDTIQGRGRFCLKKLEIAIMKAQLGRPPENSDGNTKSRGKQKPRADITFS